MAFPKILTGKPGFQAKLLIVFMALLIVVMGLLVFVHYQSEKVLLNRSVGNLRNMVNIVHYSTQSLSTEKPLSRKEVDRFLHEIVRKEGAFEASVVDFDNAIVASTNPGKIGTKSPLPPDSIGVWNLLEERDSLPDKVRYVVRIPLVRHKQVEGIVEITALLNDLRAYLWKFSQEQILIFFAALVFAFVVFSLFLRRLHRPFSRMAVAAKEVANGDFTVRLEEAAKGQEGEMAASFNHMTKKLLEQRIMEERLSALERRAILSEMGASLAHEIRNPLNLMNLTLHQMGRNFKPEVKEKQNQFQKLLDSLKNEVRHLDTIVTEFLTLGKPSRPSRKRFKLKDLVSEVSIRLNQQMATKGIRLDLACPESVEVNADQEQMRLVLLNLLLNSIDIVPPGSVIEFTADEWGPDGEVRCSVADEGPGIEPQDLEHVFEPYFSKRAGGIGLGLTLVRRIIEEHGGEIRAVNREGGGAEFRFTVPLGNA